MCLSLYSEGTVSTKAYQIFIEKEHDSIIIFFLLDVKPASPFPHFLSFHFPMSRCVLYFSVKQELSRKMRNDAFRTIPNLKVSSCRKKERKGRRRENGGERLLIDVCTSVCLPIKPSLSEQGHWRTWAVGRKKEKDFFTENLFVHISPCFPFYTFFFSFAILKGFDQCQAPQRTGRIYLFSMANYEKKGAFPSLFTNSLLQLRTSCIRGHGGTNKREKTTLAFFIADGAEIINGNSQQWNSWTSVLAL